MTGRYGLVVMRILRMAGAATVLALGTFIFVMVRRDTRARRRRPAAQHPAPSTRHPASAPTRPSMWPGTPLFPDIASTMATRVDALYFFLRRPHGLLLAAHRRPDRLLRGEVPPPRARQRRRAHRRRPRPRDHLDRDSAGDRAGHLHLGRQRLLRDGPAAGRHAEHLRRRQAVDVEVPAPERRARDQRAARTGRTAGEADHDVRGRHPRSVLPRVPREGGRHSGALHRDLVRGDAGPAAITCSAPSTAARAIRG